MTAHTEALRALARECNGFEGVGSEYFGRRLWEIIRNMENATLLAEAGSAGAVERFYLCGSDSLAGPSGPFVKYEEHIREIAALQSTLTSQQAEIEGLREKCQGWKLTAETNRLRALRIESELATLRQRVGAAEWQPMETAPKDGRWIIGGAYLSDRVTFTQGFVRYNKQDGRFYERGTMAYGWTHWRERPNSPAIDAALAEERAEGGRDG